MVPRSLRTEWNVRDSDGTLVIAPGHCLNSPGTQWTIECAQRLRRPLLLIDPSANLAIRQVRGWIDSSQIATLNVAGPSESECPGISDLTVSLLRQALIIGP